MIELKGVSYTYSRGIKSSPKALNNLNLQIKPGKFVAVIGPTGSGKSTLFSLLNGLKKPTAGQVLIEGTDIWQKGFNIRQIRFKIGEVFQYPEHQIFERSVFEEIAFGLRNKGVPEEEIKQKVSDALLFTGLPEEVLGSSPFELSEGQKRKLAIASVVAMGPEVLVLDEPTAGLDPWSSRLLLNGLKEHYGSNKTVVWASHNMEEVAEFADRVIVLDGGEIKLDGTANEVFNQVNLLNKIGLSTPKISQVFKELSAKGWEVQDGINTVKAGEQEFFRLKKAAKSQNKG